MKFDLLAVYDPPCESCYYCDACDRRVCANTEASPGEPETCDRCWVPEVPC